MIVTLIEKVYSFLWGDLVQIPLPGGSTLGISLLIILLIPTGIYFSVRTRFLPIRLFPDMVQALVEKKQQKNSLSSFQTLIVSTATRVGMGNLVGVVAAISAGGAGAVFWMWVTAIIGSSTAFIEATLAQLYKEKRSAVRRLPRRSGVLYSCICRRKTEEKEKQSGDFCVVCNLRSDLLVRYQSSDQQFCCFFI